MVNSAASISVFKGVPRGLLQEITMPLFNHKTVMKRWHRDADIGTGADDVLRNNRGGAVAYKIRDFPVTGITATGVGEFYY